MRVAAAQFNLSWNNPEANFAIVSTYAEQAADQAADLLLLPETFSTGFSLLTGAAAQDVGERSESFLQDLSKRYPFAIAGSYSKGLDSQKALNHLAIFKSGEIVGRYSKMHLFGYGGERNAYASGTSPLTITIANTRCSFFICYDLRFPVPFARAAQNTDCFFVVANWPQARISHWTTLLQARAIENQCYIVGLNRVGQGGQLLYNGQSVCFSPKGERLAFADTAEMLLVADVDVANVNTYREEFPCLKDRLPGIDCQ